MTLSRLLSISTATFGVGVLLAFGSQAVQAQNNSRTKRKRDTPTDRVAVRWIVAVYSDFSLHRGPMGPQTITGRLLSAVYSGGTVSGAFGGTSLDFYYQLFLDTGSAGVVDQSVFDRKLCQHHACGGSVRDRTERLVQFDRRYAIGCRSAFGRHRLRSSVRFRQWNPSWELLGYSCCSNDGNGLLNRWQCRGSQQHRRFRQYDGYRPLCQWHWYGGGPRTRKHCSTRTEWSTRHRHGRTSATQGNIAA